ncbi:MAG: endonuclease [Planctomycetota bacterium]
MSGSQTGSNESVAYMGELDVLLQWHAQDPPDAWEMARNDIVYSYQGNRNPFIDHPEWVDCLFGGNCGPTSSAELYCTPGEYNSSGNPASIGWFGSLVSADNNLHLEASSVPANQFAYFLAVPRAVSCTWPAAARATCASAARSAVSTCPRRSNTPVPSATLRCKST